MYRFDLETHPAFEVFRDERAGFDAVEFNLGEDAGISCLYRLRIQLNDSARKGWPDDEDVRQLWYGPVGLNADDKRGRFAMSFSPDRVGELIPKPNRQEVLDLVTTGVEVLARTIWPAYIERSTYYPNIPFKALAKYFHTGEALARAGYRLKKAQETNESKYWWLHEKNP